ncbi:MAG: hypothetical protein M3N49_09920 [Candidatus Eremiobacteraeota bacterium]|nr:hypothetical protein [Candidatus Eremiobacteraeota bacterium]
MPSFGLIAAVLCGCGGSGSGGGSAPAAQLPPGIKANSATGIYPATDEECCWTGPDVRFAVPAGAASTTVRIDVYEPKVGPFVNAPQVVSLLDARGAVIAKRKVPGGATTSITFPLAPSDVKDGAANVHLRMAVSVVPKDAGLSADVRRLALILKRVAAQ